MSFECKGLSPVEHPEYSLGLAFSQLLCEIFLIPAVHLHLFKVHAMDGCKGVLGDRRGCVCGCLFHRGGVDFSSILGTVPAMSTAVELALAALILQLLAVPNSVSVLATIEALVALRCRSLALLLLIVPG